MTKAQERHDRAVAYLEDTAEKLARQPEPCRKWLTRKQSNWLQSAFEGAGHKAGRNHGGLGKTLLYWSPAGSLAISPLNGCGSFSYFGNKAHREGDYKRKLEKSLADLEAKFAIENERWESAKEGIEYAKANDDLAAVWVKVFERIAKEAPKKILDLQEEILGTKQRLDAIDPQGLK